MISKNDGEITINNVPLKLTLSRSATYLCTSGDIRYSLLRKKKKLLLNRKIKKILRDSKSPGLSLTPGQRDVLHIQMTPRELIELLGDEEHKINLVHYKQKHTWDCGISCIMMVLPRKKRNFFAKNLKKITEEEGFGMSTWTIDLCYLLKKFLVNFTFYTIFIGVNPEHKSHYFYEKILEKDLERVTQRFKDAEKNGIIIQKKSVNSEELISHIRKFGPVILLTNGGDLQCDICKLNNTTSKLIQYLPKAVAYHGHYIVLCGYNLKKRQFYYNNPAAPSGVCAMGISAMDYARTNSGTDEDCIFIFLNMNKDDS